jgi:hypothetical protein
MSVMKNLYRQLLALLGRFILAATLAIPTVIALGVNHPAMAASAVFYSPDASDNCSDSGVHLTTGYKPTPDSVIYFCAVMPTGSVTVTGVGAGNCPSGQPQWSSQFGNLCISAYAEKPAYGTNYLSATPNGDSQSTGTPNGTVTTGCNVAIQELQAACNSRQPILKLIEIIANWIVRLLIPLAILFIIISGIQYITSQGNPDGIKKAKSRITNAVVGLILLGLMFAILNFIIPGQ